MQNPSRLEQETTPFTYSSSSIMARSLSNLKVLSALVVNGISRRGYAAASRGGAEGAKKTEEEKAGKVLWIPDPKTGYYRPENRAEEIDVAELRALLLKNKMSKN